MKPVDYWSECIADAADEAEVAMTGDQLLAIAKAVEGAHENYGQFSYSPGWGERFAEIESEWKAKYKRLEEEYARYRGNAETAVKQALGQYDDALVSICEYGEVLRHDGRTERIQ